MSKSAPKTMCRSLSKSPADPRVEQECIEVRSLLGNVRRLSVTSYEEAFHRAGYLSNSRALSFHDLGWTINAPLVHELSTQWTKPRLSEFRIGDWDTYTWQMNRLLGLG